MQAPVDQKNPQADAGYWYCCSDRPVERKSQELVTECLREGAGSSKSNCKPYPILCHNVGCSEKT